MNLQKVPVFQKGTERVRDNDDSISRSQFDGLSDQVGLIEGKGVRGISEN